MKEDEKKPGRWAKRIAYGIAAGFIYVASGNIYTCARRMDETSNVGQGHYNRCLDEGFYEEFSRDLNNLEFDLQEKKPKGKIVVPLAVYVQTGLKSYFDDANNPNDDNLWAKEVRNALSGLDIYKEFGIEFEVRSVELSGTARNLATNSYSMASMNNAEYTQGEIAIAFYPMTEQFVSGATLGQAYMGGDYSEIYLSNNEAYNKIITAHEMGHIFGFLHKDDISGWARLYDPYRIFSEYLMRPYIETQDFSLSSEEEAILEKTKERFRR